MTKDELRQKANDLPLAPGVYLMMDKTGKVIYVGKAKKLKNRVSQYFQDTASHNEKTRAMVSQVDHFDTIFVSTEFEALILENSLIKRHMPRYNILLKDDKGYPFVRLDADAAYPRFSLVGKTADDGAKYFGPFGGRRETRLAIEAVCGALHLPTCARQFPRDIGRERPCLNHHIGRCDGFCRPDGPGQAEYQARIRQAVRIFSGHYRQLTAELQQEMEQAAEELNFEKAAALRDRIRAISVLGKTQQVIAGVCADTDVWGVYPGQVRCGSAVLHIEDGNLLGREVEVFSAAADQEEADILSAVLSQYYLDRQALPREILVPCELEDMDTFAALLTGRAGHRVTLRVPQRGERAELLRMARRNAPGGGGAHHLRRRAHRQDLRAAGDPGRAGGGPPAAGILRHFPHRRAGHGGLHGGVRRRTAPEAGLSPVPGKDPGPRRRPAGHGGGAGAPVPAISGGGRALCPPAGPAADGRRPAAGGGRLPCAGKAGPHRAGAGHGKR